MDRRPFVPTIGLALLLAFPAAPAAAAVTLADYDALRAHRLGPAQAVATPGLAWNLDVAQWTLESGSYRLQEPVAGVIPGLWFAGRGRLEMDIPDRIELRQLRRLLDDPELDRLALTFDRMVLRSSGGSPMPQLAVPPAGGSTEAAYEKRHEHYFKIRRFDVDARVLAAMAVADGAYWQADFRTTEHGWVTFTYDSRRAEEITLECFDSGYDFLESWLSLDRAADRTAEGRPTSTPSPVFDVQHVEITADLSAAARKYKGSIAGQFETRLDLLVLEDSVSALPLILSPRAEVTRVADAHGQDLSFVRDHIGGRASSIDSEIYDHSLLILLPTELAAGSHLTVQVDYSLRLPKYAGGRYWYPGHGDSGGLHDRHTARLELTTDDRHELQAMGDLVEERQTEGLRTTVWQVDRPAKMLTFAMQREQYLETIEREGVPTVMTVGDLAGDRVSGLNEERIEQVATNTVNAIAYLQALLDWPLVDPQFYAALIPSSHGQAFPGFLHLGEFTAVLETPAASERFRAHEAGHQWWGHIVGWNSYRDQWLSEGIADYLALMFVHDTVDGGAKIFQEAITAYTNEVQGSLVSAFSPFARPGNALLTARGIERIGPIGHGRRASTRETPSAYRTLVYSKGALVLHMLRWTIQSKTGSGDAFVAILRDFVKTHAGGYASTEDFRAAVERQIPEDWSWFFDQWIYGAEVPTYRWDYRVTPATSGVTLRVTVEQEEVSPGFKMLVPVEVDFGKNERTSLSVLVDRASQVFEFQLPSRPRKVRFNAGDVVIAKVKKR